jgi:nicotinate-nucleotide adenylyltransferase
MKIGVFSGSFNPIHTGHAMIANYVVQTCGLDQVWLMVSRRNPLKSDSNPADDLDRLEMVKSVTARNPRLKASAFELSLPAPSFTYRTLGMLRERYPEDEFTLIIGSDNWLDFNLWRDHDRIVAEFRIIVYQRPGFYIPAEEAGVLHANVTLLQNAPLAEISSTFIREGVKKGMNLSFFLPDEVLDYIKRRNLYE